MIKLILSLIIFTQLTGFLAFAGDKERGETISIGCRGCHGQAGKAMQPMHPHLAGQNERYLTWQLSAFRSGERPSHIMNEMAKNLSDEDINDLAAYYSSLSSCD